MKAPKFAYAKPATLPAALALLDQHGEEAKVLAGGQSLVATLNMRLSSPAILIDITGIAALSGISTANGKVRIGALTRHCDIERSAEIAKSVPLLAQAVGQIAHAAIRNAGTLGGSIAFADPAAEWPACMLAVDAEFIIAGKSGERRVQARDFFKGLYTTALQPKEILVAIEIPLLGAGYRSAFLELARRHGDYAIAGVAAIAKLDAGKFRDVRLAYLGVGATPILAKGAMAAIEGNAYSAEVVAAAQQALGRELDPIGDLYSAPPTKTHLARVLTGRALAAIAA
ncbi:MAG: xanthine dehydrogenase family protein subunit M [Betaproteobacteria bacterium]|nr:xanthine dehydrogenase family protein subunit M [Betaproteobacteria bacterium]